MYIKGTIFYSGTINSTGGNTNAIENKKSISNY